MENLLTCEQAAEQFNVKAITVRDWIKVGKLRAAKLNGSVYRIRLDDLAEFEKHHRTQDGRQTTMENEKQTAMNCGDCAYDKEFGCCSRKKWQCRNGFSDAEFINILLATNKEEVRKLAAIAAICDKSLHLSKFIDKPGGGPEGGGRYRIRPEDLADFEKLLGTKEGANGTH